MALNYPLDSTLFLDIETAPICKTFDEMSTAMQEMWLHKCLNSQVMKEGGNPKQAFFEKAGIYAEFSKVICISVGYLQITEEYDPVTNKNIQIPVQIRIRSFSGHNERIVLLEFAEMVNKYYADGSRNAWVAHNGLEFDYPVLSRRMIVNRVPLPKPLDIAGSKSWNNAWLLDTMNLWKFGDYKSYTSLALLAAVFDIPTPKDDISGKDIADVYYNQSDLARIINYCQKDVITLIKIYCRIHLLELPENIEIVIKEDFAVD
ncbi:MAG: ribonuclease H-like domain-containing protein [Bacteroidota bacterium]|nr:ribonuclease H-like domain-containing protein [Bacteroidota bacterium]